MRRFFDCSVGGPGYLSVAQIADRLHFADSASFCKFFSRTKGLTPKEFRKQ